MSEPIAFKLRDGVATVHPICLDDMIGKRLAGRGRSVNRAVLAVSEVAMLDPMGAGVFDGDRVQVLSEGDWSNALLIVMPALDAIRSGAQEESDAEFLRHLERVAPELSALGRKLIEAVRTAGVEGSLYLEGHRWVNRPLNTFTIAVQTRVKNFQFTLYGGPERFGVTDFIRSDQNGYSRGWVRSEADIPKFVELASIAYARKRS